MHETFCLIAEPFQITREPPCLIDDPVWVSDDLSRSVAGISMAARKGPIGLVVELVSG